MKKEEKKTKRDIKNEVTDEPVERHGYSKSFSVMIMTALWIILGSVVFYGIFNVLSKKKSMDTSLEKHVTYAYKLIKTDTPDNLAKAEQELLKASEIKQRDLRIWAGLSLIKSRIAWEYDLPASAWKIYYGTGKKLIAQDGFNKVMNIKVEPFWLESRLFYDLKTAKTNKELLKVYFEAQKAWGIYPEHAGIATVYAITLTKIGNISKAYKVLENINNPVAVASEIIISLNTGNLKNAATALQKLKKLSPGHPYIGFTDKYLIFKKTGKITNSELNSEFEKYPNLKAWNELFVFFAKPASSKSKLLKKYLFNTNFEFIAKDIIDFEISRGETGNAADLFEKVFKGYLESNTKTSELKARILIASGFPEKALKLLKNDKNIELKVKSLWFSEKYKQAEKESKKLNQSNVWKTVFSAKSVSELPAKHNIIVAFLMRQQCSEPEKTIKILAPFVKNTEYSFYASVKTAQCLLVAAQKAGIGTIQSEKYIKEAEKHLEKHSESLIYKRLQARIEFFKGNYEEALGKAGKICNYGLPENSSLVCGSPQSTDKDKIFLLRLLTLRSSPEKDLELSVSKAVKLIKILPLSQEDAFYWKTKLGLLKIRLLPSRLNGIVKNIFDSYEILKKSKKVSLKTETAMIPIFIITGKYNEALKIIKKSNSPMLYFNTLSFLYETGSKRETSLLADEIIKKFKDITPKLKAKIFELKASVLKPQKAVPLLEESVKIHKSASAVTLLINSYLKLVNSTGNKDEYCKKLRQLLSENEKLPDYKKLNAAIVKACNNPPKSKNDK